LAIAAKRIIMSPIGELSPIDPTTANQFNPRDQNNQASLGIGVEDVTAYQEFWRTALDLDGSAGNHTILSPTSPAYHRRSIH
jgi:hypothetical protein